VDVPAEEADPSDNQPPTPGAPPDAYLKALQQLERMRLQEEAPGAPPAEPESWFLGPRRWLASVLPWPVPRAQAQAGQCAGAPSWVPIGPAPLRLYNPLLGADVSNAGIVKAIAVDPANSQKLFIGARNSGIWRTTNQGGSWTPMPNDVPSHRNETLLVHPDNSNVVFAGTGLGAATFDGGGNTDLKKAVGTLRSTDGGATWYRIGPSCCQGSGCASGCPPLADPTTSTLEVKGIAIDSNRRVYVATSKGLWYSDNAHNFQVPCSCAQGPCTTCQVTWTRATIPNVDVTAVVTHVFVSAVSSTTVYANVPEGSQAGWYKSTNRAQGSWTTINGSGSTALPLTNGLGRAAIARGGVTGNDTIYSIARGVPSSQCGAGQQRDRLYRTTDSGATWQALDFGIGSQQACEGGPCNPDCIEGGKNVVQVHPTDPKIVAFGGVSLFRSTNTGCLSQNNPPGCVATQNVQRIGAGIIHADQNALTFDPNNPNVLFVGNDGGIWSANFATSPITWTFMNGNLATLEFYHGDHSLLNYGHSAGGTQDNSHMRGGTSDLLWRKTLSAWGDGVRVVFDHKEPNAAYVTGFPEYPGTRPRKTTDGGLSFVPKDSGLAQPVAVHSDTITMDPVDNRTLVVLSLSNQPTKPRVYRTTTAAEPEGGNPAWVAISPPDTLPDHILSLAIPKAPAGAQRSDLIFAGGRGVWRTTNAGEWSQIDQCPGGPCQLTRNRRITSFAFHPVQPCDAVNCTIYVSVDGLNVGPDGADPVPGHVFRSTNSGFNWQDISAGLPDVPANDVVVHPTDANTIFVATDMGIYRGTLSGGSWSWCPYMNGFPQTALVEDLSVHAESGLLRAFTYGRSAWEVQAFPIPDPAVKVDNDASNPPATRADYPRISASTDPGTGRYYAVAWIDDRVGQGQWHLYHKAYDSSQSPPTAVAGDLRVDTTANAHVVGWPSLSAHPLLATATPYCSRLAWDDDRLDPGWYKHVYTQFVCTDGYRLFANDLRVDQHATSLNAKVPAITFQRSLDFAVAWQADRGDGKYDIYARFFGVFGSPKGNQFRVSSASADYVGIPAIISDAASRVFIAWPESAPGLSGTRRIMMAKYDANGGLLVSPVLVNTGDDTAWRSGVQLALDSAERVLVTWWERAGGTLEYSVHMRRFDNALAPVDSVQAKVNQPPSTPPGAADADLPAIAADGTDVLIVWRGLANIGGGPLAAYNAFGRGFDGNRVTKKNDFRVDLVPRGFSLVWPGVVRTATPGRFAYVWQDDRAARNVRYDVYTRVAPAFP
jgi:hypothetical protein